MSDPNTPTRPADAAHSRLQLSFDGQVATFQLHDNATTRALMALLPATLEISDFSNEKIIHLPQRLDESGYERYGDPTAGDLCYFTGWGNLAMFQESYPARRDLIRLGRIEGGVVPLLHKGTFPVTLELV